MSSYKATIGLEIHAELKTKSKMFCSCKNSQDNESEINVINKYVCPVCMSHPGTLPVVNKEAVRKVLSVGIALGSRIADFTEFDRKNYFYPDIPKGYQISQYKYPLVVGGTLAGVEITRIHLEEDTARSSHEKPGKSLVDFNRAGVPLMELVTEPVIHSAEEAMNFGRELQILLQYMDISDANMEKGQMRVEVNISIFPTPVGEIDKIDSFVPNKLGTKVEVKNINSFKAAGKAIEYEFARQSAVLDAGDKVQQETRGWDENKQITFSQRSKENSDDYRYFPDPDIPKFKLSDIPEFSREEILKTIPEIPSQKRDRYLKKYGLKAEDIENYVFNREIGDFFEKAVDFLGDYDVEAIKMLSNYVVSDITGIIKASNLPFPDAFGHLIPSYIATIVKMIMGGDLSSRGAKEIIKILHEKGLNQSEGLVGQTGKSVLGGIKELAEQEGLLQKSDPEELKKIIQGIMDANPLVVADYKSGKESVFQFFVGQAMKLTKGSGNPEIIKGIILELLK
ncbi:MAG: Asp-tRNA(Asn)/Glu-tRNA(Gln) amidotransferase subunit GatB [Minisyncoccota bacterium]